MSRPPPPWMSHIIWMTPKLDFDPIETDYYCLYFQDRIRRHRTSHLRAIVKVARTFEKKRGLSNPCTLNTHPQCKEKSVVVAVVVVVFAFLLMLFGGTLIRSLGNSCCWSWWWWCGSVGGVVVVSVAFESVDVVVNSNDIVFAVTFLFTWELLFCKRFDAVASIAVVVDDVTLHLEKICCWLWLFEHTSAIRFALDRHSDNYFLFSSSCT